MTDTLVTLIGDLTTLEADTTKREVSGVGLPYGVPLKRDHHSGAVYQVWEPGSAVPRSQVALYVKHDHQIGGWPIGLVSSIKDKDSKQVELVGRISETTKGNDALVLAQDGIFRQFSLGGYERAGRLENAGTPEATYYHTEVDVFEFSLCVDGAYGDLAAVKAVLEKFPPHDPTTEGKANTVTPEELQALLAALPKSAETVALEEQIEDMTRKIATLGAPAGGAAQSKFNSPGEYMQALAAGDDEAKALFLDQGTTVEADAASRPGWISRSLKLRDQKRKIINLFTTERLPATGMSVEFPFVASTTGDVDKQAAEAAALAYMELALDTGTSPVITMGGYSRLTRQAIERADLPYLDAVHRFQLLSYAKQSNAFARAYLLAIVAGHEEEVAAYKAKALRIAVGNAAAFIEDTSLGLEADFILVSGDVGTAIGAMEDSTGRPLFEVKAGTGSNAIGSANLVKATFDVEGVPGAVDRSLPAGTAKVCSAEAMSTLENPGAPTTLEDESIINLTKDFSLYGYGAFTKNDVNGIVDLDLTGFLAAADD